MTSRQEKFAELVASGMTQRAAYREAYPNSRKWKDASVDNKASALAKTGEVSARLRGARAAAAQKSRLTRERKLALIEADVEKAVAAGDRYGLIALLKLHNEMTGDNAPVKTEATVDILTAIAVRHKDVLGDA